MIGAMEQPFSTQDHRHSAMDDRLERLERRIRALEADLAAVQRDRGPHYYESGSIHPELDDQAITP